MTQREKTETRTGSLPRLLAVFALVSVVAFAAAAPALAQDPTANQYASPVNQVNNDVGGGSNQQESGLQENVVNGLPFTGLDVIALCAVALALASIGFALRRMTDVHPR
jgi:hypothetical protein